MKKQRILYVDLLRVVCCLLVVAYHFAMAFKQFGLGGDITPYTHIGNICATCAVACFFMVSGAMLEYQYGDKTFKIGTYYKKRFLSIYPVFWLAWLVAFLDGLYFGRSIPLAPKPNFLLTFFGVDGYLIVNGATGIRPEDTYYKVGEWFLGAILILYLVYPLIRWVSKKCKFIPPVILLAGALFIMYQNPFKEVVNTSILLNLFYFSFGMFLQQLLSGLSERKARVTKRVLGGVGVVLLGYMFFGPNLHATFREQYVHFAGAIGLYLTAMLIGEFLDSPKISGKGFVRLFAAWVRTLGKYTFAVFLVHHFFLHRYLSQFSGTSWNNTGVLVLFLAVLIHIYLLAVLVDWLSKKIVASIRKYFVKESDGPVVSESATDKDAKKE